ncbi:MAG: thioesterase family protein [Hyphomicrobiales bacterium]
MKESLKTGLSTIRKFTVDDSRAISFMGDDCRIYGTPEMIRDIEWTCRDLMIEHAGPGEDSVGVKVNVTHTAATLLGMDVKIAVEIAEINRNKVVFNVTGTDPVDTICTGQHERFIVNVEQIKQRLEDKAAKAA